MSWICTYSTWMWAFVWSRTQAPRSWMWMSVADLNYSSQFTCQTLIESLSVRSLKRVAGFQTGGHFIRARLEQREVEVFLKRPADVWMFVSGCVWCVKTVNVSKNTADWSAAAAVGGIFSSAIWSCCLWYFLSWHETCAPSLMYVLYHLHSVNQPQLCDLWPHTHVDECTASLLKLKALL